MNNQNQMPPLGIMPEFIWKEFRIWDLIECLARNRHQENIPLEWLIELRLLLNERYVGTKLY